VLGCGACSPMPYAGEREERPHRSRYSRWRLAWARASNAFHKWHSEMASGETNWNGEDPGSLRGLARERIAGRVGTSRAWSIVDRP
jgi:hypothetical protein